jgi:hypothetical protein
MYRVANPEACIQSQFSETDIHTPFLEGERDEVRMLFLCGNLDKCPERPPFLNEGVRKILHRRAENNKLLIRCYDAAAKQERAFICHKCLPGLYPPEYGSDAMYLQCRDTVPRHPRAFRKDLIAVKLVHRTDASWPIVAYHPLEVRQILQHNLLRLGAIHVSAEYINQDISRPAFDEGMPLHAATAARNNTYTFGSGLDLPSSLAADRADRHINSCA